MRRKIFKRASFALVALVGSLITVEAAAIIGRPLTPVSFAGAARRSVRRGAYGYGYGYHPYGAAAVGAAAAVGTAAAISTLPHGCYPGAPCGGVVYEPQYSGPNVVYVPR